jgi:hypothetical protein
MPLADKSDEPKPSASTAVIPPATPTAERDHQLEEPERSQVEQTANSAMDESRGTEQRQPEVNGSEPDPATIDWYYRDPHGNEQGR